MSFIKYVCHDGLVLEMSLEELLQGTNFCIQCLTCGVCGKLFTIYEEPRTFKCVNRKYFRICGVEERSSFACPDGHYICKKCAALRGRCSHGKDKG